MGRVHVVQPGYTRSHGSGNHSLYSVGDAPCKLHLGCTCSFIAQLLASFPGVEASGHLSPDFRHYAELPKTFGR